MTMVLAPLYLDSSAVVKLVTAEAETLSLLRLVAGRQLVSSLLARVEVLRALARSRVPVADLAAAFETITLVQLHGAIVELAATIAPPSLRSLDAIHLATALLLPQPAPALITYDQRLATAASSHGLEVLAPR